jgi:hypothetical protein
MAVFGEEAAKATEVVRGEVRKFLESATLYDPKIISAPHPISLLSLKIERNVLPSSITYPCPTCETEETTSWQRQLPIEGDSLSQRVKPARERDVDSYRCVSCGKSVIEFWLKFEPTKAAHVPAPSGSVPGCTEFKIVKVGQYPKWSLRMSPRLKKALGNEHARFFQNALACISEGLGIGASAYFRRIIEDKTEILIAQVEKAAKVEGDERALANVATARAAATAEQRLKVAAECLPPMLRPAGTNPLKVLYSVLSGHLHTESEQVAIEECKRIIKAFSFLFENLEDQLKVVADFGQQLQSIGEEVANRKKGDA